MRIAGPLILLVITSICVCGQRLNGYAFGGIGGVSEGGGSTLHFGIGGEAVLGKGIGVGGEIGALGPTESFSNAVGVFSVNGYYHFARGNFDPFVTAGYSRLQREGGLNTINYGGGFNYWLARHLGVRIEFRDHAHWDHGAIHFYGVRFGVVF